MSQGKSSDTQRQSVTAEERSLNGVAKLRPQPPRNSQTTPSPANPSATSDGNGSGSAGQSGNGS